MTDPADSDASGQDRPRRRRRAVGPPGARPAVDEPRADSWSDEAREDPQDVARLLADVPPHHGPV